MSKLLAPVGFLVVSGLVTLSSLDPRLFFLQSLWVVVGVFLVMLFYSIDWRSFFHYRWSVHGLYVATIFLLLLVYLTAPVIRNTRSWLVLGPLHFQPVELMKISLIFLFAQYFSRRHIGVARWGYLAMSFLYLFIPLLLVLLQPDLGSAVVLFSIWWGFLLVSGLPFRRLALGLFIFAVFGAIMWGFGLKTYQRERIIGLFYPERDILGINYSVTQSKIAIGSSGFFGKGYHQGSQTQLGFLTQPSDDFIFAAFVEEWGWGAGLLALGAFFMLVFQILRVGVRAEKNVEKFICLGAVIVLGVQFLLNTGSTTGLVPVVGVTFPFMSYGGSSLLTSFFLVAIINAIAVRYR